MRGLFFIIYIYDNPLMATLHLICGMAGAGKTTLAKQIKAETSAIRFSPDEWISHLLADLNDRHESERLRDIVEAMQWDLTQQLLSSGLSVILENGFWGKSERESCRDTARKLGARVQLQYLDVTEDELLRRISKRNNNLPEGSFIVTEAELHEWLTWFQKPNAEELDTYDKGESA